MKRTLTVLTVAALVSVCQGAAARAASTPFDSRLAQDRPPLPDFELTKLDGTVIHSSAELPAVGKWLLVYVQPNCRPCDRLLDLVKQDEHPDLPWKMVIIAGGGRAGASAIREKRADLAGAQWYADESRQAWASLRMSGTPMVFGVRDKTIQWSLSGMLKSDAEVKSILASWAGE